MAYIQDPDLEFLGELDNEKLGVLVGTLAKDTDGESRFTEMLTVSDEYKQYYPNHQKYWRIIAEEIQTFGGNTFMNLFRGGGVLYKEILIDVCEKMKVDFDKQSSTELIESSLLTKILEKAIENMNPQELEALAKELNLKTTDFSKQAILLATQSIFIAGGFRSYQLAVIIANQIATSLLGSGLTVATNAALTRGLAILGPIGVAATVIWTAITIAGPAYRVTIPICIEIACLRIINEQEKSKNARSIIKRLWDYFCKIIFWWR